MKHVQFLQILDEVNVKLHALTASKGEEYKGGEDDQIGNFRRMATKTGLTMEQIWQVFFHKHIDAIDTFVRDKAAGKDRARSEPIESRIDDAILYLVLLRAILRDQAGTNEHWLMEAHRQMGGTPKPDTTRNAAPDRLYIGCPTMSDDAKAAKAQGQRTHNFVTIIHHPDSLHGVEGGGEFWWVGIHGDPLAIEFEEKCKLRGLAFHNYLRG